MEVFRYNSTESYEENFNTWFATNCVERGTCNEKIYPLPEARKVFDQFYEQRLSHSIKMNKDGRLQDILVEDP